MDLDFGQVEEVPVDFRQRLFAGYPDVCEQMRVVGEVAKRLSLPATLPYQPPSVPDPGQHCFPVFLMKSEAISRRSQGQGWHRQAPRGVKCLIPYSRIVRPGAPRQTMLSPACPSFPNEVARCARACRR
jgi:hypothetical protein